MRTNSIQSTHYLCNRVHQGSANTAKWNPDTVEQFYRVTEKVDNDKFILLSKYLFI